MSYTHSEHNTQIEIGISQCWCTQSNRQIMKMYIDLLKQVKDHLQSA